MKQGHLAVMCSLSLLYLLYVCLPVLSRTLLKKRFLMSPRLHTWLNKGLIGLETKCTYEKSNISTFSHCWSYCMCMSYVLRTVEMIQTHWPNRCSVQCVCESALGGIWRLQTGCSTETERGEGSLHTGMCLCDGGCTHRSSEEGEGYVRSATE